MSGVSRDEGDVVEQIPLLADAIGKSMWSPSSTKLDWESL